MTLALESQENWVGMGQVGIPNTKYQVNPGTNFFKTLPIDTKFQFKLRSAITGYLKVYPDDPSPGLFSVEWREREKRYLCQTNCKNVRKKLALEGCFQSPQRHKNNVLLSPRKSLISERTSTNRKPRSFLPANKGY